MRRLPIILLLATPLALAGPLDAERRLGASPDVADAIHLAGLEEGEAPRLWVDVRLALARGQAARAQAQLTLAAIDAATPSREWKEALLAQLAEIDAAALDATDGVSAALKLWSLASQGRCAEIGPLWGVASEAATNSNEARRRLAEGAARCGRTAAALAWAATPLTSRDSRDPALDPRDLLSYGTVLLLSGDEDGAAVWCEAARTRTQDLPRWKHDAADCSAIAGARQGRLPSSSAAWIAAQRERAEDPLEPSGRRAQAAFNAAFSALTSSAGTAAESALQILGNAKAQLPPGSSLGLGAALTALSLADLGRIDAAASALATIPPNLSIEAQAVRAAAEARVAERQGSVIDAESGLTRASAAMRAAQRFDLALFISNRRLEFELRRKAGVDAARSDLLQAVGDWPWSSQGRDSAALFDPALTRLALIAALDATLDPAYGAGPSTPGETLRSLQLTWFRLSGFKAQNDAVPSLDAVQWRLAALGAGLIAIVPGGDHSLIWRVDQSGCVARALPSGDRLWAVAQGNLHSSDTVELHAALAMIFPRGSELLLLLDGFLRGVDWAQTAPPPDLSGTSQLSDAYDLALVPSLRTVTASAAMRAATPIEASTFFLLTRGGTGEQPRPNQFGASRFGSFDALIAGGARGGDWRGHIANGTSVLHLELPLLGNGDPETGPVLLGAIGDNGFGTPFRMRDLFGGATLDLLSFAATASPEMPAASRVRAGLAAIDAGATAAFVATRSWPAERERKIWRRLYEGIASGKSYAEALGELHSGAATADPEPGCGLILVGHAGTSLMEPSSDPWPFWLMLGTGVALIAITVWRLTRKARDPFDREPPEEE